MQYTETLTPGVARWTRRIIVANAIVYLLTLTLFRGTGLSARFAFTPALALQQPWSAITYMFLHGGLLHLAFNMLVLFFFGSAVERRMGEQRYPIYYLVCGIGGAALSFVFAFGSPIIGASAAVYGVALAFAYYWPDNEILVFPIPVPIKAKWLVAFLAVSSLLFAVRTTNDGVAHFAHLGGFAAGAIYLWAAGRSSSAPKANKKPSVLVYPAVKTSTPRQARNDRRRDDKLLRDVDRVLDKIAESGMESLTAEERKILDESSKHMRHN